MNEADSPIVSRRRHLGAKPLREILTSALCSMQASRCCREIEEKIGDTGKSIGPTFGMEMIDTFEIGRPSAECQVARTHENMRSIVAPEHPDLRVETAIPNGHRLQGVFSANANRPLLAECHAHAVSVG